MWSFSLCCVVYPLTNEFKWHPSWLWSFSVDIMLNHPFLRLVAKGRHMILSTTRVKAASKSFKTKRLALSVCKDKHLDRQAEEPAIKAQHLTDLLKILYVGVSWLSSKRFHFKIPRPFNLHANSFFERKLLSRKFDVTTPADAVKAPPCLVIFYEGDLKDLLLLFSDKE